MIRTPLKSVPRPSYPTRFVRPLSFITTLRRSAVVAAAAFALGASGCAAQGMSSAGSTAPLSETGKSPWDHDGLPPPAGLAERARTAGVPVRVQPAGQGQLWITTTPAAQVYVDGRLLGVTPLVRVSIPAGRHVLMLRSLDGTLTVRRTIMVDAGKDLRLTIDLRAPSGP